MSSPTRHPGTSSPKPNSLPNGGRSLQEIRKSLLEKKELEQSWHDAQKRAKELRDQIKAMYPDEEKPGANDVVVFYRKIKKAQGKHASALKRKSVSDEAKKVHAKLVDFTDYVMQGIKDDSWFGEFSTEMHEAENNLRMTEFDRVRRHKYRALFDQEELDTYKHLKSDAHRESFIETWKTKHPELADKFPADDMPPEGNGTVPVTPEQ